MEYSAGDALDSPNGNTEDDRRASDRSEPRMNERPKKQFLKEAAKNSPKHRSFLAGVDDEDIGISEPKLARKRASRLTAAVAARDGFGELVEISNPIRPASDLILNRTSGATLLGVANEFRRSDEIRRHGLHVRSKLLFCGPPGCGKTMCAEVMASELHMPLVVARLDAIIASHLGETASNLRKLFDAAKTRSMVLFLDEFDALARARSDATEHSEIRRVVNSLLMMIDKFEGNSILIAATNLEETVDRAIWRRFDEVVEFELPTKFQIARLLKIKTRNFPASFEIAKFAESFEGMSFAQVERTCLTAIRTSILSKRDTIQEKAFKSALEHERRRADVERKILN